MTLSAEEKRNHVLVTLNRLATRGTKSHTNIEDLEQKCDIGEDFKEDFKSAIDFLRHKGFVEKFNRRIEITVSGIEEAERIVAETYRSKERRILQKLYDERERRYTNPHQSEELARELNLDLREVQDIVIALEGKGLAEGNDQATWIVGPGMEAIESDGQQTGASSISYNTNIYGDNKGNIAQGGQGHNQTVINHQPISEILPKLAELIAAVKQADFPDKDDVVRDLEKAQELAIANPNATPKEGVWKRIQGKLDVAKTSMEIVGFGYDSLPYWPLVWNFFFG